MNKNETVLDIDDHSSLEKVIKTLILTYPRIEPNLWDKATESYSPNALVLINGIEAGNLDGLRTKIEDETEIVILSVTHGG